MACVLTRRETDGVFEGKTGETVEIAIRSPRPAGLVRMTYAGTDDGEPPFTFTIQEGRHKLLVVAIGESEGVQRMQVVEDPDGEDCHLKNFFWSPRRFFTVLDIEGI